MEALQRHPANAGGLIIYAAWFDLHNDDIIVAHPTALRVYAHLLRNPMGFMHPQEIKIWLIARNLKTNNRRVINALNLLVARGYLLEHDRGDNKARRFTIAMERHDPPAVTLLAQQFPNGTAPKSA